MDTSVSGQRCADLAAGSAGRSHHFKSDPWRTSSPLHQNLGFRYTQAIWRNQTGSGHSEPRSIATTAITRKPFEISFDPQTISYRKLLEFFFQIHDPSTLNRQGNDGGASYRSAIFYTSDEQKRIAEDTIADVDASGLWPGKVVTEVAPAGPFWEAEPEHQDYLEKYPDGYTSQSGHSPKNAAEYRGTQLRTTPQKQPAHRAIRALAQRELHGIDAPVLAPLEASSKVKKNFVRFRLGCELGAGR